jgi:hypothetical protein
MSKKINESHLIVLKKNTDDEGVSIDYLPIVNPSRGLFDDAYLKCDNFICLILVIYTLITLRNYMHFIANSVPNQKTYDTI